MATIYACLFPALVVEDKRGARNGAKRRLLPTRRSEVSHPKEKDEGDLSASYNGCFRLSSM